MKKVIFTLIFVGFVFSGCSVIKPINTIPITPDSNVSVIYFRSIGAGGTLTPPRCIEFCVYVKDVATYFDTSKLQIRNTGNRMYIFNLPPDTYYVRAVYPDSVPSKSGFKGDSQGITFSHNTHIQFNKESFMKFPLKVEKGKFNIFGKFKANRDGMFTYKGHVTTSDKLNPGVEKKEFLKKFGKEAPEWAEFIHKATPGIEIPPDPKPNYLD